MQHFVRQGCIGKGERAWMTWRNDTILLLLSLLRKFDLVKPDCFTLLCYYSSNVKCFAQRHWDGSAAFLFPTSAVLGHNPNICHLLYHINPGSLTKKNNTCTVFMRRGVEREDDRVLGTRKRRDKEKEIFNNVCILMWERAERVWVCEGKNGGET